MKFKSVSEQLKSAGIGNYIDNLYRYMDVHIADEGESEIAQVYFSPYYRLPIHMFKRVPKVFVIHDFAFLKFNYYSDRGGVFHYLRKIEYLVRHYLIMRSADAIIVHTQFVKDELAKFYPKFPQEKVHVVLLGLDHMELSADPTFEQLLPKDWEKRGYFLYTGGVQFNKNAEGTLKSFRLFVDRLLAQGRDVKQIPYLVLGGKIFMNDSRQAQMIRELVSELDLDDYIHFTGFFEDSQRYSLIKNCIAFIHLSIYEGFGLAVGEAMLVGAAVIADNNSTYPEIAGDSVLLVDGRDNIACADAIIDMYNSPDLRNKLGAAAIERAKQYLWEESAKNTVEVMKQAYIKYYEEN